MQMRSAVRALAAGLAMVLSHVALAQELIAVKVDQAILVKLPERVTTLVIGNPLIVDALVQPGGLMVLTGKGFGATNLIALDRQGQVIMERNITVEAARDTLVLYRGIRRETYSCQPNCEPRITLGDDGGHFNAALGQASTRARAAESASSGGTNRR